MEKIKLEDFLKDPLPGRWIKDKDGFLVKAESEEIKSADEQKKSSGDERHPEHSSSLVSDEDPGA